MLWTFAVPGIPVTVNTDKKARKRRWTQRVRQYAVASLRNAPLPLMGDLAVSVTYFHEDPPLDVDNMLKPIVDGLWPQIMLDDKQIRDVSASRRDLTKDLSFTNPPVELISALALNQPFVLIQIGIPIDEEGILWIGK